MNDQRRVRGAQFSLCEVSGCKDGNGEERPPHICVTKVVVALEPNLVTAISYTWGKHHRTQKCIGHYTDGTDVLMKLGDEWSATDFGRTLVRISASSKTDSCWIDQLCINQTAGEQEIGAALASIPSIFRSCPVAIMLPGSLCSCWANINFNDSTPVGQDAANRLARTAYQQCERNSVIFYWFQRVWTRQEMWYAPSIEVFWASEAHSTCTAVPHAVDDNSHLVQIRSHQSAKLALVGWMEPRGPWGISFERLDITLAKLLKGHRFTKTEDEILRDSFFTGQLDGLLPELRGMGIQGQNMLQNISPSLSAAPRGHEIRIFLQSFAELGGALRAATRPRDYVLAIFPDLNGYQIPPKFREMSLVQLLEDALQQVDALQRKLGDFNPRIFHPCTSIPAGLSDDTEPSYKWIPGSYNGLQEPESCGQVYAPFTQSGTLGNLDMYGGMMCVTWQAPTRAQRNLPPWQTEQEFQQLPRREQIRFLIRALQSMKICLMARLRSWPRLAEQRQLYDWLQRSRPVEHLALPAFESFYQTKPEGAVLADLIRLISAALGMNDHTNLQPMFRTQANAQQYPIVGMIRAQHIYRGPFPTTSTIMPVDDEVNRMHISYEAVLSPELRHDRPCCRIIGVWVEHCGEPSEQGDADETICLAI